MVDRVASMMEQGFCARGAPPPCQGLSGEIGAQQIAPISLATVITGGGGSACGAVMAGVDVIAAVDAWELACATYRDNNPLARVYHTTREELDPIRIRKRSDRLI